MRSCLELMSSNSDLERPLQSKLPHKARIRNDASALEKVDPASSTPWRIVLNAEGSK